MSNKNYLSIYAKSFNWAGFFLPNKTYQKCSSLYDFCRTVDNIADHDGELDIKKKNLSAFKNDFINKNYNNIIIKNMWNLMNNHLISIKIVKTYLMVLNQI
jgi:phytoene synthase